MVGFNRDYLNRWQALVGHLERAGVDAAARAIADHPFEHYDARAYGTISSPAELGEYLRINELADRCNEAPRALLRRTLIDAANEVHEIIAGRRIYTADGIPERRLWRLQHIAA